MGGTTGITWTDSTWNPVRGCSRVSEGCRNCYAERVAARFSDPGMPYHGLARRKLTIVNNEERDPGNRREARWTGVVRMVPEHLGDPMRWRRPRRIFVNSMSDLFHEQLSDHDIEEVFAVMALAPRHTFQILTKRATRMREWMTRSGASATVRGRAWEMLGRAGIGRVIERPDLYRHEGVTERPWPLPNVWLGVSVENQAAADERIPELLRTPAAVRFLSCEPLLGPVTLGPVGMHYAYRCKTCGDNARPDHDGTCYHCGDDCELSRDRIDWVIAGCESGPGARACDVEWLRSLRDQCAAAAVPYFLKQAVHIDGACTLTDIRPIPQILGRLGEVIPVIGVGAGSKEKGRGLVELPYLDGIQHAAFPVTASPGEGDRCQIQ